MANRVLLLLALASRNHPNSSSKILSETAGLYNFFFAFLIFVFYFIELSFCTFQVSITAWILFSVFMLFMPLLM